MNRTSVPVLAAVLICVSSGCQPADDRVERPTTQSNLTPGMAKSTIVKGSTKQAEIIEVFGPPDLVTHRDDMQVWTYDKIAYDVEETGGTVTIFREGRRRRSSSTSTMLIIYFDDSDTVQDYRMNTIKF
jgi:outer membrane protein assembly factor BamE (lipoprotein component of BamABCDE complex)